jgi:hypothetical protein
MSDTLYDFEADWQSGSLPGETRQADPEASGVAGSAGISMGTGTGQHGVVPLTGGDQMGVTGAIESMWRTLHKPFDAPLDALDITLIVGVVMVAVIFWSLILYHIRIAAEAI